MTKENLDKIEQKKIDAEAKRRYPVNWRHTTPSERVAVFDDGLDSRSAFVAGAYFAISEIKSDKEKEKALKEIRKEYKQFYDEYTSVNVRLAEKEKEIDELEFWKEQNDIAHAELKSNYLKVYDELKSKEKEIAELKDALDFANRAVKIGLEVGSDKLAEARQEIERLQRKLAEYEKMK